MSHRTLLAIAAALVLGAPALINCSSTPAPTEEEVDVFAPRFDTSPADAAETYEAAIPWLHGDAHLVIAAAQPGIVDLPALMPVLFDDRALASDEPGSREALAADITEAMRDTVGFDPADIDGYAVAYSEGVFSAVAFGDLEEIQNLEPIDVDGHTLHHRDDGLGFLPGGGEGDIYLLPMDAPRPGVAIATDAELLASMADGEASLAATGQSDRYDPFFTTEDTRFAAASPFDEYVEMDDDPYPGAVGFSLGTRLEVLIEADEATLPRIETDFETALADIIEDAKRLRKEAGHFSDRLRDTFAFHLATSVDERLESDRVDGRLRYRYELVDVDDDSIYESPILPLFATLVLLEDVLIGHGSPLGTTPPGAVEPPAATERPARELPE